MNWCAEFFDDLFAEHHLVRSDEQELNDTISFFKEKLHLQNGYTIFDQCCGVGDLSIALAKHGYKTIAMDLIGSYIERAKKDALSANVDCRFDIGDAHEYVAPELCDASINWWTSFGYTPDDNQNIKMLQCMSKSLKSGAWFTLDYMNAPQRIKQFEDTDLAISQINKPDCTIIWESRFDKEKNMVVKKWIYLDKLGNKTEKQGGGAKLYTTDELLSMFTSCGFKNIKFYGGISGEDLSVTSTRCIVVAQKE